MKHPKWLLIIVLILLAINIAFYTIWYAFDVQGKVRVELESFLSKTMNGTLQIQKLSINERQITVNRASFYDKTSNIRISVKQIRIRYNLLRLIVSGFKINNVVKDIVVYEPNAFIRIDLKPPSGKKPFEFPDITAYFNKLNIIKGQIHFILAKADSLGESSFLFEEKLNNVDAEVNNTRHSDIVLKAISENNGQFELKSILDKGLLSEAQLQINNYEPLSLNIKEINLLHTNLSLTLNYSKISKQNKPDFDVSSIIRNTSVEYNNYKLYIPYVLLKGNKNVLQFSIRESDINTHKFHVAGFFSDLLTQPYLKTSVSLDRIDLNDIMNDLNGEATGMLKVETDFKTIMASGEFYGPTIRYQKEEIRNLDVKVDFSDHKLSVSTSDFYWRNQATRLLGNYNLIDQKIHANLISIPQSYSKDFNVNLDIETNLDLSNKSINAEIAVNKLGFSNTNYNFQDFNGKVSVRSNNLINKDFFVELNLKDASGTSISATGRTGKSDYTADISFDSISVNDYLPSLKEHDLISVLSGDIKANMHNHEVTGNSSLKVNMTSPKLLNGAFNTSYNYSLDTKQGTLSLKADSAYSQNTPFDLQFAAAIDKSLVTIEHFELDKVLKADGKINLVNIYDSKFSVKADSIDTSKYWNMFVPLRIAPPVSTFLTMNLDYNQSIVGEVKGLIRADSIKIEHLKPMNTIIQFSGTTSNVNVNAEIQTAGNSYVSIESQILTQPDLDIDANANFTQFDAQDLFIDKNIIGIVNGSVKWKFSARHDKSPLQSLSCKLSGEKIRVNDIPIDKLLVNVSQLNEVLLIDSLQVESKNLLKLSGSGALDYNFLTNNYFNGNHTVNVAFDGDLLRWVKSYASFIENARGRVKFNAAIQTDENGINIKNGNISMSNGMLRLNNQIETINDLDLEGTISDNELDLKNLSCQIGSGKLFISNAIDPGEDNFFIGPLNLGYLLIHTDDAGIQISIPDYLPPNTVATAKVKGQNGKDATIKGPFDDMEINGEILASNGSVVYPANTKNIMQLISLFQKPERKGEDIPLPFTLDLLIKVQDNVHYVTYPAFLTCLPGSFLRLTYDGNKWNAQEADFVSEKGTLDFYGTTFNVDNVKIEINAQRNILSINGVFTKKAADGTVVTLTATTNPQKGPDVFNQLEFNLTSDNPQDKSITQILSRLRYNRNIEELTPEQRQSLLQDEAMQLISTSVTTTYVSQFLSPN